MAAETSSVVVSAVLVLWRLILVEFCISMWVCTGVCAHGWRCHWSPKEGIWSPGASGTGGCELLRMGAGDRTWFPCKNPWYHLSSPCPHYLCCSSKFSISPQLVCKESAVYFSAGAVISSPGRLLFSSCDAKHPGTFNTFWRVSKAAIRKSMPRSGIWQCSLKCALYFLLI